jgi:hypothetical protein
MGGGMNPALETPQGQLATSLTAIIGDKNDQFLLLTQGCDPKYASGRMQDGIARIYFIERKPAVPTSVQATCTGIAGVKIPSRSLARASDGNTYACVSGGTIGVNGTVVLSFECTTTGPVDCPAGSLTTIYRSVPGWDTIINPSDGVIGSNVESRRDFEIRRQASVAKNAVGSLPAIQGAVLNVPNIIDAYTTDNPSGTQIIVDGVTLPPNSLYVCVSGGDPQAVAQAIWTKKMPGCPMAGNTTMTVQDTNSGYSPPYPSYQIKFQTASPAGFVVTVRITASNLVPSNAVDLVRAAVLSAFSGGDGGSRARIGSTVYSSRFYSGVATLGSWAEIISIKIGTTNSPKAIFGASISGTTMTVTAISFGVIGVGHTVSGAGLGPNITIVSFGSGSGGTGTYNLSLPQSLSTRQFVSVLADMDVAQVGIAHVPVLSAGDISVVLV